jgi:hypothetical protein
MNTVVKKFALAALCTTALTTLSQTSQAATTFDIVGGGFTSFNYSSNPGDNNVINAASTPVTGSTVYDPNTTPVLEGVQMVQQTNNVWHASTGSSLANTAVLSVSGLAANQGYTISWTYIGNEAANLNVFSVTQPTNNTSTATIVANSATGTAGNNSNSSCCGGINPTSPTPMGLTVYNNGANPISTPGFTVKDVSTGTFVSNTGVAGSNPVPNGGQANLIFAYLTTGTHGFQWDLTTTATNTIVFGFNDDGSGDDNHDDFMAIATVTAGGLEGTPIPGALPLFGTVLGGGLLARRLRKRKAQASAA